MPRYIISQVVAFTTIIVGWTVLIGGSTLAYLWIDKATIVALLPATMSAVVTAFPNYVFLTPAACVFVFGLLIAAIGHTLHVSLGSAQYPGEDGAVDSRRNPYDF